MMEYIIYVDEDSARKYRRVIEHLQRCFTPRSVDEWMEMNVINIRVINGIVLFD